MEARSLDDLAADACYLTALIEGIDVLYREARGPADCPVARRARNALTPVLDAAIEKAGRLADDLDKAVLEDRRQEADAAKK